LLGLLDLPLCGARQVLGAVRDHDHFRRYDRKGDVDEEWRLLSAGGTNEHSDRQVDCRVLALDGALRLD
jgi:hypothetical protein